MRKIWRDALDKVTPYEAGPPLEQVEKELGLPSVIRLSANENPLGPSPRWWRALRREAARVHLYPDGGSQRVRAALGEWIGVDPAWLMVGNGADELIGFLARAAFGPGDEVVVPHPSFEPYSTEALLSGADVVASPLRNYETDLDDMRARVTARTKAVFICTPHNPASTIVGEGPLRRFIESLGADAPLVVLDEAYRDFCDDPETPDGVALAREFPFVISLRTFSKIAGLAGPADRLRDRPAGGHRPAQPGARALQRQPPRPGRGGRGARRPAPTSTARAPTSSPSGRGWRRRSGSAAPSCRRRRRTSSSSRWTRGRASCARRS